MGFSTHVLNTSTGRPAEGVRATLAVRRNEVWTELGSSATNADGRCGDLLPPDARFDRGWYRVHFETGAYYAERGERCLYPYVEIIFEVTDERHYHVPLLLAANGYTTYRGS